MKIEIDIIDRIYYNIEDFCAANGTDVATYMADAVVERYNLDKYGDLNEKIKPKTPEKETKPRKTVSKAPTVQKAEEKVEPVVETPREEKPEEVKPIENISEKPDNVEISSEKPKHTKRTLKAK